MKRINQYKKLFSVEKEIDLKTLKKTYRNLVKEWHPDKFQEDDAKSQEAEVQSRAIIDGYHFLVSIAPETKAANLEAYTETITNAGIADYNHKGQVLEITFLDGTTYEYFGVTKQVYIKMINSNKLIALLNVQSILTTYTENPSAHFKRRKIEVILIDNREFFCYHSFKNN